MKDELIAAKASAVQALTKAGYSASVIAKLLSLSDRQVMNYRKKGIQDTKLNYHQQRNADALRSIVPARATPNPAFDAPSDREIVRKIDAWIKQGRFTLTEMAVKSGRTQHFILSRMALLDIDLDDYEKRVANESE
jgi:hypothetical protein